MPNNDNTIIIIHISHFLYHVFVIFRQIHTLKRSFVDKHSSRNLSVNCKHLAYGSLPLCTAVSCRGTIWSLRQSKGCIRLDLLN